ncbi:phosphotransferase [Streptomyces sp. NPDC057638]|uniref:phosphotransferase n=1 Tax=Streptomyces sp. NPDC057638 TaxID=3346190 RepID=UPI0036CB79C6
MRDEPEGIDTAAVGRALRAWDIEAEAVTYEPVGFGDYHWSVRDARGRRWFVTLSDLDDKDHCGVGAEAAWAGLSRAMDTAYALRTHGGLDFVVAPLLTGEGRSLVRLGERYALAVFPYREGVGGAFGRTPAAPERAMTVDMLAELHRATPPDATPVLSAELSARTRLESALGELDRPWEGGPFAEPARALLAESAAVLARRLEEFDRRLARLKRGAGDLVVTHGETHPGNLLWHSGRPLLLDWDTVGLAVPERDLWELAAEPEDLARYADLSGRAPDPSALAFYRLRWDLEDLTVYLGWFRSRHTRTQDTEAGWSGLAEILKRLAEGAGDDGVT